MATVVNIPIEEIYQKWATAVSEVVGENYTMDDIDEIATTPYAKLVLIGNPTNSSDLDGNEDSVQMTFQVDCYASGQNALSKVYEIDRASHIAMMSMGFIRNYGCSLEKNKDLRIKRTISRYIRVLADEDVI